MIAPAAAVLPPSHAPGAQAVAVPPGPGYAVVVAEHLAAFAVGDDIPPPVLLRLGSRRVDRELQAFLDDRALDRAGQVEATAHGSRGRQQPVGGGQVRCPRWARV